MSPACADPSCISESIQSLILPWCWRATGPKSCSCEFPRLSLSVPQDPGHAEPLHGLRLAGKGRWADMLPVGPCGHRPPTPCSCPHCAPPALACSEAASGPAASQCSIPVSEQGQRTEQVPPVPHQPLQHHRLRPLCAQALPAGGSAWTSSAQRLGRGSMGIPGRSGAQPAPAGAGEQLPNHKSLGDAEAVPLLWALQQLCCPPAWWWVGVRGCARCSAMVQVRGLWGREGGTNKTRAAGQQAGQGLAADEVEEHVGRAAGSVIFWDFQKRLEE